MPNLQEVSVVAAIAVDRVERLAPSLAEKIATDLPEIFGGNVADATKAINATHMDEAALSRLAHSFQTSLDKFGLPKTASPTDLFAAAQEQGFGSDHVSTVMGRGSITTTKWIGLGDGNTLRHLSTSRVNCRFICLFFYRVICPIF
jgi:hypothetical protein